MNELWLWKTLWTRVHRGEGPPSAVPSEASTDDDESALLAEALDRLGDQPLRLRVAFAGFVPWLWSSSSSELRRRAVRLLRGSGTRAALRIATEALDDEDDALRSEGLEVLRVAAERAPLRWSHALFHPRADVRARAIEALPHPQAARMLPWLRADPVHGKHPAVMGAPLSLGLALELWRGSELTDVELAEHFGQAPPHELMAVLRSGPLRDPTMVGAWLQAKAEGPANPDESEPDQDILDTWCALWQSVPPARDAMLRALGAGLSAQQTERDREPIKRRIAAAARKHYDAHPDAVPLASVAIACAPGLLSPARWTVSAQRLAAQGLHRRLALRTKVVPTHLPSFIDAPVVRNEDGTHDITIALNLVAWFGAPVIDTLESRFSEPALHERIAATPACWPALVESTGEEQQLVELIARVQAHDPSAGLRIIGLGLGRWAQAEPSLPWLESLLSSVDTKDMVEIFSWMVPPSTELASLNPAIDAVAVRLTKASLVAAVGHGLSMADDRLGAHIVGRLLHGPAPDKFKSLVARFGREPLAAMVAALMRTPEAWSSLDDERRAALARALRGRGPVARAKAAWSKTEWPAVESWIDASLDPSVAPSVEPSVAPSLDPSVAPSLDPSVAPSLDPSVAPSLDPSLVPSLDPSLVPSLDPSLDPSLAPSVAPSLVPSLLPRLVLGEGEGAGAEGFRGLDPNVWIVHEGRGLAEVVLTLMKTTPWSARIGMARTVCATIVEQLRASKGDDFGTTGVKLANWLKTPRPMWQCSTFVGGIVHVVAALDEPPELAEPIANVLAAGLRHEIFRAQLEAQLDEHSTLIERVAPDISPQARRVLRDWPALFGVPARDPVARPWLDRATDGRERSFDPDADPIVRCHAHSMDAVLEAVDELVADGVDGQARMLELLEAGTRPVAVEAIARSVARWEDSPIRDRAEALVDDPAVPIWLRFRIGLGLAPSDVIHWLPWLCALACEPLPRVDGQQLSWLSSNDWDGLVALARMAWAESTGLFRRIVAGARRWLKGGDEADDEAMVRLSIALADSPHPHAHGRALPRLHRVRDEPEVVEALGRATQVCWALPLSKQEPLVQALSPDSLDALPFQLQSMIFADDREAALREIPRAHHAAVARGVLDAMVLMGEGDHAGCLALLQALPPSVDVDTQWRRLLQDAPTGAVRTAVVEHVRTLPGRDDKLQQIADTFAWGIRTGRVLTGNLFDIRMTRRQEDLGFTRAGESTLHVSPGAILTDHPQGRDIVEGLILHELGHHIHHHSPKALAVWEKARKAGLGSLLNLVADEHLERNLRAEEPGYGHRLKRLATYAFQQLSRDIPVFTVLQICGLRAFAALHVRPLEVADADDSIRLRSGQVLAELDRVGHPIARFVRALRMGMGNRYGDPVLDKALALFRGGFRHLDMAGLYRVAMQLSRLYGVVAQPPESGGGGSGGGAQGDEQADAGESTSGGSGAGDLLEIFGGHETLPGQDAAEQAGLSDADVQREIKKIFAPPKATPRETPKTVPRARVINVSSDAKFKRINRIVPMTFDAQAHRAAAAEVRRPAARLRQDFVRLGLAHVPQRARLSGRAFDRTRTTAVVIKRDPRMLVARKIEVATDLFMGVAIDCSGSMSGQGIDKARRFGVLLAEAARGMRNVDARFVGFSDRELFDAGNERVCAVTALKVTGGNNDAAALAHVAGLARASRRRSKLLIMISDGLPTECSTTALRTLVGELSTRHKMLCAQIAVTSISEPCFEHYIEVLDEGMDVSVRRFGEIVVGLARKAMRG